MQRIAVIASVALVAVLAIWHPAPRAPIAINEPSAKPSFHRTKTGVPSREQLVVYVAGEVARPGIYRLPSGARVDDAVRRAGGLLKSADPLAVNLAARLIDGEEVAVAVPGAKPAARARRTSRAPKSANVPESVSLNAADARTLAQVPGIGPTLARRIVELREQEGGFTSLDQLLDVAGFSPSRLELASRYLIL